MTRYVDPSSGAAPQPGGYAGGMLAEEPTQQGSHLADKQPGGPEIVAWPEAFNVDTPDGFGLGRNVVIDLRDTNYLMTSVIPKTTKREERYWNAEGAWLNQGSLPHCVGASWTHFLKDGPVTYDKPVDMNWAGRLYREAQKVDQWPGENYDGTSVRAGAQILQKWGLIGEYRWAYDVMTVARAILDVGPVVVGTVWTTSMFKPDPTGLLNVSGKVAGGHAYVLNGVNMKTERIRIKNSWGRDWGQRGHATVSFRDMDRLLKAQGEACLAVEIDKPVESIS